MKNVVISLGGSLIIPEEMDVTFLDQFRKTVQKYYKTHRFIIVCGGGSIARKYIAGLRKEKRSEKEISLAGIRATRMNAAFMMQFFGKEANDTLPLDMHTVKNNIHKNKVVICGALRYTPKSTSDSTAARLAHMLKCDFINITNVSGLYTADPHINKKAKLIRKISWKAFEEKARAKEYENGQHFVLDQRAAIFIRQNSVKTFIIGKNLKNFRNILDNKEFEGTLITKND